MMFKYTLKETRYHATMIKLSQNGGETMEIVCLDLEGVLVPEIWIAFAEETGMPE